MTRRLILDTTSGNCSICLADGQDIIDFRHVALGRGHAEHVLPLISQLSGGGACDAIAVSIGPGSFTGVRIGLAAARALGFAWTVPVTGYGALMALSAAACVAYPELRGQGHAVVIPGGHGEYFVQIFTADGKAEGQTQSLNPAAAAQLLPSCLVGSAAQAVITERGFGQAFPVEADARHALLLPTTSFSDQVAPDYARGADAKPAAATMGIL
jgi:tRNA threonylcarbamoyladenosine biosynthesis protein TsaB